MRRSTGSISSVPLAGDSRNRMAKLYRLVGFGRGVAIARSRPCIPGLGRCPALYREGWQQRDHGQFDQAARAFYELLVLGRCYGHQGWITAATSALEGLAAEMAAAAALSPSRPFSSESQTTAATLYARAVDLQTRSTSDALALLQQALQVAVAEQDACTTGRCLNAIGQMQLEAQQYEQAAAHCRAAAEVLAECQVPRQSAIAFHNLGLAHYQQGHTSEALRCFRTALDHWQSEADCLGIALTLDYLGRAYAQNSEHWLALGSFEAAIDVINDLSEWQDVRFAAAALAEQMAHLGEQTGYPEIAIAYWDDALRLYQSLQAEAQVTLAWHQLARLHQQLGQNAIAQHYLRLAR